MYAIKYEPCLKESRKLFRYKEFKYAEEVKYVYVFNYNSFMVVFLQRKRFALFGSNKASDLRMSNSWASFTD